MLLCTTMSLATKLCVPGNRRVEHRRLAARLDGDDLVPQHVARAEVDEERVGHRVGDAAHQRARHALLVHAMAAALDLAEPFDQVVRAQRAVDEHALALDVVPDLARDRVAATDRRRAREPRRRDARPDAQAPRGAPNRRA